MVLTLPRPNGIPHCQDNVYPLSRGHPLEEVQNLFLVSLWWDSILFELHIYVLAGLQLFKNLGYPVAEDEKLVLPALQIEGH